MVLSTMSRQNRGAVETTSVQLHRRIAIHEDVLQDAVIPSAAEEDCALDFVEYVSRDFRPAHAVVHVPPPSSSMPTPPVSWMKLFRVAPKGEVATGVDRADVSGLRRDVMGSR